MKNFPESMRPLPLPKSTTAKREQEYYNDLPGKIPPEISNTKLTSKSPMPEKRRERVSSNLINFDVVDHDYVNDNKVEGEDSDDDLFDDLATS